MVKDALIGVISVESPELKPFSEHDELLITIVANQAASAVQNARLYSAAERRRAELAEAHDNLKQLNETLEDRVRERTQELECAINELRETQAQLVQSGKMASLGMLSAGVAHEINTPIGAINSSVDVESRALAIIHEASDDPAFTTLAETYPKLGRAVKILEDSNGVTREAAGRVAAIIQSLRSFAKLDQADYQSMDLNEGIESTLTLMQHLICDRIEVAKDFGDLPKIECFASQINQVFMSLLTNAVQSIEETGTVTVTTRHDGTTVTIEVSDTGCGISPEHLEKVFDPGFTTKGVGVGVGLGLSTAYRIMEDHKGSIQIQSEIGRGTTFTLQLPTSPPL